MKVHQSHETIPLKTCYILLWDTNLLVTRENIFCFYKVRHSKVQSTVGIPTQNSLICSLSCPSGKGPAILVSIFRRSHPHTRNHPGTHTQEAELQSFHHGVPVRQLPLGLLSTQQPHEHDDQPPWSVTAPPRPWRPPAAAPHDEHDAAARPGRDGLNAAAPAAAAVAATAAALLAPWRRAWRGRCRHQVLRRVRGQDHGQVPAARARPLLAQRVPQVLVLPGHAGGHWIVVFHEGRDDPLQKRLHQVSFADVRCCCFWTVFDRREKTHVLSCHFNEVEWLSSKLYFIITKFGLYPSLSSTFIHKSSFITHQNSV